MTLRHKVEGFHSVEKSSPPSRGENGTIRSRIQEEILLSGQIRDGIQIVKTGFRIGYGVSIIRRINRISDKQLVHVQREEVVQL